MIACGYGSTGAISQKTDKRQVHSPNRLLFPVRRFRQFCRQRGAVVFSEPRLRRLCRPLGAQHPHSLGWRARDSAGPRRRRRKPKRLIMFNYIFPIFCFGVVITGIVFLGIFEAASQLKAENSRGRGLMHQESQSKSEAISPTPSPSLGGSQIL